MASQFRISTEEYRCQWAPALILPESKFCDKIAVFGAGTDGVVGAQRIT